MYRVTVGVVSWYSTSFITNLFHNLRETALESDLEFIICDNTNGEDRELYDALGDDYQIIPFNPIVPRMWRRERRFGSCAHGLGLNFLLTKVNTECCLFVDPDCLILAKGWDIVCRSMLSDNCVAVGVPYHSTKIPKYHNFPSPVFIFFRTEAFRKMGADWLAYMQPMIGEIKDLFLRAMAIWGGQLGERLVGRSFYHSRVAQIMRTVFGGSAKDTGWRLPSQARKLGYSARLFTPAIVPEQLHPPLASEPTVLSLMNEFEVYLHQNIPLVTHYYGVGHRRKGNVSESVQRWKTLSSAVADICREIDLNNYRSQGAIEKPFSKKHL
ncbi:MAG: glycosyltransferase family A protein [Candidatus Methanomethylicaceae archaeon]